MDRYLYKLDKSYPNVMTVLDENGKSQKCPCNCGQYLEQYTTWDNIFNQNGKKLVREKKSKSLTVETLAQQLKQRLLQEKLLTPEQLKPISDIAMIDSYITCSCCDNKMLPLEEALKLVSICESAEEWLELTAQYRHQN